MSDDEAFMLGDDILGEFIDEAFEHLTTLESGLLQLGETTDPAGELVSSLFRAMHSIKGAAGFMHLNNIVDLAHVAENLLSQVRDGALIVKPETVDALLQGCDILRELFDNPRASAPAGLRPAIHRLEDIIQGKSTSAATTGSSEKISVATPPTSSTSSSSEAPPLHPSIESIPDTLLDAYDGGYLYFMCNSLSALQTQGVPDVYSWLRDLKDLGTPLGVHQGELWTPYSENINLNDNTKAFTLLFATPLEAELLEAATLLDQKNIMQISSTNDENIPSYHVEATERHRQVTSEQKTDSTRAPKASTGAAQVPAPQGQPIPPETLTPVISPRISEVPAESTTQPEATAAGAPTAGTGRNIRISVDLMDTIMALAGELVLVRNQQLTMMDGADTRVRDKIQRLDAVTSQLQEAIMQTRMQPIGNLFDKFPRIVRDLGRRLEKEIVLEATGRDVELDKIILENLSDPLTHIIRNSCDHGIEPASERILLGKPTAGTISIRAFQEGGQIIIEINDDGHGIDPARIRTKALERGMRTAHDLDIMSEREVIDLVMQAGFSTAETISEISGRGVGMDVVRSSIESLGGTIEINSRLGRGTKLTLRLPLTLAIIPSLIVRSGEDRFAIPQASLEELVAIRPDGSRGRLEVAHEQEVFRLRNRLLPVVRLSEVLSHPQPMNAETSRAIVERYAAERSPSAKSCPPMAVVKTGSDRYGLIIDEIIGTEEIVVKPIHLALKRMRCFSGCTIMGDGRVAFILDIDGISQHAEVPFTQHAADERRMEKKASGTHPHNMDEETHDVFLFRYGAEEQFAIPLTMVQRIENITKDEIQRVGNREFVTRNGVSTYILRLDKVLDVSSPMTESSEMHLLMCKFMRRPVGLLITSIIDTLETTIHFREDSYLEDGILGSMNLHGQLTLFPDIFRIVEKAEPEWFPSRSLPQRQMGHRRVLLVEDAEFFRQTVSRYLRDAGFEVITANHGREALSILNNETFDIVVSDLVMPEMDGWALAEEIRRRPERRNMPMLALSSVQNEADQRKALASGFDRYVPKFDREAFLVGVLELLDACSKPLLTTTCTVGADAR